MKLFKYSDHTEIWNDDYTMYLGRYDPVRNPNGGFYEEFTRNFYIGEDDCWYTREEFLTLHYERGNLSAEEFLMETL